MTQDKANMLKIAEDEMMAWADTLPQWKQAVLYRYLNGSYQTTDVFDVHTYLLY